MKYLREFAEYIAFQDKEYGDSMEGVFSEEIVNKFLKK